jgi:hypothetical protein
MPRFLAIVSSQQPFNARDDNLKPNQESLIRGWAARQGRIFRMPLNYLIKGFIRGNGLGELSKKPRVDGMLTWQKKMEANNAHPLVAFGYPSSDNPHCLTSSALAPAEVRPWC